MPWYEIILVVFAVSAISGIFLWAFRQLRDETEQVDRRKFLQLLARERPASLQIRHADVSSVPEVGFSFEFVSTQARPGVTKRYCARCILAAARRKRERWLYAYELFLEKAEWSNDGLDSVGIIRSPADLLSPGDFPSD